MSIVFGPVPSRRFGISLGIDLSPNLKQCNFDCLYCELKKAKTISSYSDVILVDTIIESVQKALQENQKIDVLTVTANGEPTLYPYLQELIERLNLIKNGAKTLILSNGSTIYNTKVQEALKQFDIVKLSLDCITQECFKKLDRNDSSVKSDLLVEGMVDFRAIYHKELIIEVLFVKTLNDNYEEIELLHQALLKIKPNRVDIGTIDRPPAYNVAPISYESLEKIANKFDGLNVAIAYKNRPKFEKDFLENEILDLLQRRPLTEDDINNTFSVKAKLVLEKLVELKKVTQTSVGGVRFYKI